MNKYIQKLNFYHWLIICSFLLYLFWAITIPYNEAPDEYMRYDIPKFIYQYGYLPHGGDERIRNSIWGFSYAFSPITSYIVAALFMKITSIFTTSANALLISARMVSILFSTGTIFFVTKISRTFFDEKFAKLMCVLIAFFPEFAFISSYVNNDAFGLFTISTCMYGVIFAEKRQWNMNSCILLGISIGLCLISYTNAFEVIPIVFLYALLSVITDKKITGNKMIYIILRVIWVIIPAILVSGWWYIRNYMLYDGDFWGTRTANQYSELYAMDGYKASERKSLMQQRISIPYMLFEMGWLKITLRSFFAGFGYLNLFLSNIVYQIYYIILTIGLVGNCLNLKRKQNFEKYRNKTIFLFCMIIFCIVSIILSIYFSYCNDYQPQGRYCLPMLIALMILATNGYMKIEYCTKYTINKAYQNMYNVIHCTVICIFVILHMYALLWVIFPKYMR